MDGIMGILKPGGWFPFFKFSLTSYKEGEEMLQKEEASTWLRWQGLSVLSPGLTHFFFKPSFVLFSGGGGSPADGFMQLLGGAGGGGGGEGASTNNIVKILLGLAKSYFNVKGESSTAIQVGN